MKRILLGVLAIALSFSAMAAGPGAVRKSIEASMLLTGTIVVGPEGRVTQYSIDQPEKIAKGVLDFVDGNVSGWTFEPTLLDGKPVLTRNRMSIRVVANKQENGDFAVRLSGVSFLPFKAEEGTQVSSTRKTPPRYPVGAARAGATGTVYLIVKVGRNGKVEDVIAEQVNLEFVATENIMEQARKLFADASIQVARQWKYIPPVKGEDVDAPYWSVRVPIRYSMEGSKAHQYGQWESYVPGPRQQIPWKDLRDLPSFSPDTMVAGDDLYPAGKGLRLLTPLQGG